MRTLRRKNVVLGGPAQAGWLDVCAGIIAVVLPVNVP